MVGGIEQGSRSFVDELGENVSYLVFCNGNEVRLKLIVIPHSCCGRAIYKYSTGGWRPDLAIVSADVYLPFRASTAALLPTESWIYRDEIHRTSCGTSRCASGPNDYMIDFVPQERWI